MPRPRASQAAADEDVLAGPRAGGWRETPDHHDHHAPDAAVLLLLSFCLSRLSSTTVVSAACGVLLLLGLLLDSRDMVPTMSSNS